MHTDMEMSLDTYQPLNKNEDKFGGEVEKDKSHVIPPQEGMSAVCTHSTLDKHDSM